MPSTETRNLDKYIRDFRDEPEIADEDKAAVMELVNALASEGAGPSRQWETMKLKPVAIELSIDEKVEGRVIELAKNQRFDRGK